MSELKLLNCPFCNGKAEFVKIGIAKDIQLGFVRCTECGIRLRQGNCTEDFARDEWNRRTPMANIVEKLEELKKEDLQGCEKVSQEVCNNYFDCGLCLIDRIINIVKQEINKEN